VTDHISCACFRLREVDVKAEHFERHAQRLEQERDEWEKKYEVRSEATDSIVYVLTIYAFDRTQRLNIAHPKRSLMNSQRAWNIFELLVSLSATSYGDNGADEPLFLIFTSLWLLSLGSDLEKEVAPVYCTVYSFLQSIQPGQSILLNHVLSSVHYGKKTQPLYLIRSDAHIHYSTIVHRLGCGALWNELHGADG
jgi:hypothetical protein